ncbi:MAG: hypothetical protein M3N42_11070, partial [Cyanobacteriota bacterium]|nr:hypothetical protein [Cyanobacteriota bacterium]
KKIEVHVLCSDGIYRLHPRGTQYLIRSFYNLKEAKLTIEAGCLLTLLKGKSIDDFRDDNKVPTETKSTVQEPQDGYTESTATIVISYSSPGISFSSTTGTSSPSPTPSPAPTPTGDLTLPTIFREFQKSKFYDIQSVVSFLLGRAGITKIYGSVGGKIRGPINFNGSLIEQAGELCFKASPPSYIWADKDTVRIVPINVTNNPAALVVVIGKDEVEYNPLDSGLDVIKELVVSGTIDKKNTEKPEGSVETINPDGSKQKTTTTQDYGPETIINFNGSPTNQILLSTTTTTEIIQASQKVVNTLRVERRGLVVPNSQANRSSFVESFKSTKTQYFSPNPANDGRLEYEEEEVKEPICKVLAGFLGTYSDVNLTFPLGFDAVGGQTYPADSWLLNTTLILSSKTRTNYSYDSKGVQTATNSVTQEYVSKVLTTYWPFNGTLAPSKQVVEQWMRWGLNEIHQVIAKTTYQERYASELEALDEKLWKDKAAAGITEITSIPVYTRTGTVEGSSSISYDSKDINTFQVKSETRMSLVSEKDGNKTEQSRAGLANAPATEYLPNYSEAGEDGEAVDDWETEEIKVKKYWHFDFACSGQIPPKEFTSIGQVPNKTILNQIANILYAYRQGKSKAYELTIGLDDWWLLGNYRPVLTIQVVEPDENAMTYLLTGLNFSCEPTANLILGDLWWIGGTANSLISNALGNWLNTGVDTTEEESIAYQVGDRVEVGATGGAIPGVTPSRYWVSGIQIVDGQQQIQLSESQNGTPITVTGDVIGEPRITTVVAKEPTLAFAQLVKWTESKPTDWLGLTLDDWLIYEVN